MIVYFLVMKSKRCKPGLLTLFIKIIFLLLYNTQSITSRLEVVYKEYCVGIAFAEKAMVYSADTNVSLRDVRENSRLKIFSATCSREKTKSCSCLRQSLKTGMYHLRTLPAAQAIQFTVDQKALKKKKSEEVRRNEETMACALQNKEVCAVLKVVWKNRHTACACVYLSLKPWPNECNIMI